MRLRYIGRGARCLAVAGAFMVATVSCTSGSESGPNDANSGPPPAASASGGVEGAPVSRASAIELTGIGEFGGSVAIKIAEISAVEVASGLPGGASGPAVALTIEV